MRILILGGTVFLGRHLVEEALARGHAVTVFTRGRHNPDLFPQTERLRGDRDGGLDALDGRRWDTVIDTSGHLPRLVRQSAEYLSVAAKHYVFISTLAVYAGFPREPGLNESAPTVTPFDPGMEKVTPQTMGPLKALCEQALESAMEGRTLIVRAGLLAGPHDPTDRFTYWPRRVDAGGEILAPGRPTSPIQFIDARDLARWTMEATESLRIGIYNVTGPASPLTMEQFLDACSSETGNGAQFTWVDDRFLLAAGVKPMMDLPLWAAGARGAAAVDCAKAFTAGLRLRPLAETIRDTLAWDKAHGAGAHFHAGLDDGRERQLLQQWHRRHAMAAIAEGSSQ